MPCPEVSAPAVGSIATTPPGVQVSPNSRYVMYITWSDGETRSPNSLPNGYNGVVFDGIPCTYAAILTTWQQGSDGQWTAISQYKFPSPPWGNQVNIP